MESMKKWRDMFRMFRTDKKYILLLTLTALCSYGFKVTHFAIGIDDTPYAYYFEEGLAAIVGRWVLFLLNKIVHISQLAPFLTDFAAVLILMAAVTVWCVLFYSILGKKIPKCAYFFFACIFLSCPLISEVFTYFLHNGVAIGYLCCAVSLCFLREGLCRGKETKRVREWMPFAGSALFLWIALGCYESFMVVWLAGVCLMFLTGRIAGQRTGMWKGLGMAALTAAAALLLRSLMLVAVTKLFGLEYLQEEAVQRSVTELAGWMFEPGALSEFAMMLKRVFVMYGVFAYAYYPVRIFVLAAVILVCYSIYRAIRNRDIWIVLLCIATFVSSFLLVLVEGKATLYRSAQFLPLFCGYGALIFVYACRGLWLRPKKEKIPKSGHTSPAGGKKRYLLGKMAVMALFGVILFNQCADINRWFYVDYMKYENAKDVVSQIAYDLEKGFDTSKPVVFTGTYEVPEGIIGDAYVAYNSDTFYKMKRITDRVDIHLLEKFNRSYGVWVAQTPALSVIDWGKYAFDDDTELVRFFAMHGYRLKPLTDRSLYETAEQFALNLPSFPREGYIADMGDYLIVNF